MRLVLLGLALLGFGGAMLTLAPPAAAASSALRQTVPPASVQKPIEQVRMVRRCRVVRVWRRDRYGRRHLVPVRRCHRVHVY